MYTKGQAGSTIGARLTVEPTGIGADVNGGPVTLGKASVDFGTSKGLSVQGEYMTKDNKVNFNAGGELEGVVVGAEGQYSKYDAGPPDVFDSGSAAKHGGNVSFGGAKLLQSAHSRIETTSSDGSQSLGVKSEIKMGLIIVPEISIEVGVRRNPIDE